MLAAKRTVWGVAALVTAASWSQRVQAGNGIHPRTPVLFHEGCCESGPPQLECIRVVDRAVDPVVHLPYDIPYEDTCVGEDEVEDSRRHMFFAFDRQRDPREFMPLWVTAADVWRARDLWLVLSEPPGVEDVLDSNPDWYDHWWRLTRDDVRRPITCEMADLGVDWDLSSSIGRTLPGDPVPVGAYEIYGYTWEPPLNLWSQRREVIKVIDSMDPDSDVPAVAITSPEIIIWPDDVAVIDGCVDAADGSTITAYYGPTAAGANDWTPFLQEEPVVDGPLTVDFIPPAEVVGDSAYIRIDIDDPMGRSYTAFMPHAVVVLEAGLPRPRVGAGSTFGSVCEADCSTDSGTTGSGTSAGTSSAGTGPGTSTSTSTATGASSDTSGGSDATGSSTSSGSETGTAEGDGPCGCTTTSPRYDALVSALLGLLLARRRRAA